MKLKFYYFYEAISDNSWIFHSFRSVKSIFISNLGLTAIGWLRVVKVSGLDRRSSFKLYNALVSSRALQIIFKEK